jgi:carnitine 3-dehydrogenase
MPPEGKLTFHGTIGEAVEGAEYVQESVSERIELKHKVYAQLQQANPGVLIGSSTSGSRRRDLQKGMPRAGKHHRRASVQPGLPAAAVRDLGATANPPRGGRERPCRS